MLIGEAEILGQVKDAYVAAKRAKSLGRTLDRLFREALAAGKTARAQTRIGGESVSIATAAVEAARSRLATLEGKSILVIGAGKMGRTAVKRLRQEGADRVIVANRTMSRSRGLVAEAGFGEAVEMPELVDALAVADVVVASTGASHFIVGEERVRAAMARRSDRPLFIVDIAVPRDVDPAVASIDNVSLVDIDGLKSVVDERLDLRREAIPAVEEIIAEYVERFENWYRARFAVPVIARLTQKAEAIRACGARAAAGALPRFERARTHARHRNDADDRLETLTFGHSQDPREGDARSRRGAFERARPGRSLRARGWQRVAAEVVSFSSAQARVIRAC